MALLALGPVRIGAQSYPQLHVVALSQRSDRAAVAPNDIFHLTIHVKIAQQRARLDELILGSFTNCEIISNETIHSATADGTDFIERLTVQALAPGDATISPAYIDALDPSIGKAMRFSSNAIRVHVTGDPPPERAFRAVVATARRVLVAAAIGIGFVAAIFVLGVIFVRGRKRRPVIPAAPLRPEPAPAPAASAAPDERLARGTAAYRAARSEASLADLRGTLLELAGAARGSTLADALTALGESDRPLRLALLAAERALFGPANGRLSAGDEMLVAIQAYVERRAPNRDAWTR